MTAGESSARDRPSPEEREATVGAAVRGDEAALARLHHWWGPGLARYFGTKLAARRGTAGQTQGAEELAQEAWIEFWRALQAGRYDPSRAQPSTFLYAIASNVWRRHLRRAGRAGTGLDAAAADAIVGDEPDPAEVSDLAAVLETIRGVVRGADPDSGLDAADRAILSGLAQGQTDRELAAELGVSPSTAHARKKAALERLRTYLGSKGHRE